MNTMKHTFYILYSTIALMALATLGLSSCRSTKIMTDTSEKIETTAFSSSSSSSSESQSTALRYSLSLDSLFLLYLFDDTEAGTLRTTTSPTATLQEDSCGYVATGKPVPVSSLGSLENSKSSIGLQGTMDRSRIPSCTKGIMIGAYGLKVGKDSSGTKGFCSFSAMSDSASISETKEVKESKIRDGTRPLGGIFSFIIGTLFIIGIWWLVHRR